MTRIELGTGVGATNFNPTDFSYTRTTKDGEIPIINYLVGTHFNENLDGMMTNSNSVNLQNADTYVSGGKLNIEGDSTAETNETNSATHNTFTYLWPKTEINSNLELATEQVGEISPNVAYDQIARTVIEDLSNGDQIIIALHSGNSVAGTRAWLALSEKVGGVTTELEQVDLPTGELKCDWRLKFLDEGVTKFFYKFDSVDPVLLWKGDITADVAECKVIHELETNENTPVRTVKFGFIWILYKSIYVGYDIAPENKDKARICIWDTNGTETEADWVRVYSKDHFFVGDKVFENGIVRIRFKDTPEMEVYGWQTFGTPAWTKVGSLIPENSAGSLATNLVDVIIRKFNRDLVVIDVNYGIVTHTYRLAVGMSYVRVKLRSKQFTFGTDKPLFCLSSDDEDLNLTKWNQLKSDNADRGNPLGTYQGATNPAVFTFDNDVDTGLGHIDDVWFAFYDDVPDDLVGWIGSFYKPNALEVEAVTSTQLKEARFGFDKDNLIAIGVLNGHPGTKINGKPEVFFPGTEDMYVKWKANASIFSFDQNPFVRKRR
jgi:hypothetical protein